MDVEKRAGTQKDSQICCGQFISKIARKCRVLTEDVVMSLSALIYYWDLDMITFRDLIDFDGKLIPEDPQSGVPRVGILRPPRESIHDLYDRMVLSVVPTFATTVSAAAQDDDGVRDEARRWGTELWYCNAGKEKEKENDA
ncbi:hypothetical protein Tco_0054552 [Tanacetum coccineum]